MIKFVSKSKTDKEFVMVATTDETISLPELLEKFKKFCLAVGFHPENVRQLIDAHDHNMVVDENGDLQSALAENSEYFD